jgi:predicted ABC-type ATPase
MPTRIAAGLSASAPESVAIAAGRVMLARVDEPARQRRSFGFETTFASRSLAPWLRVRRAEDYAVHLVFLWLASPELTLARVARRVELGGHSVPDEVVRRRYAGLRNFFGLYRPIVSTWLIYDSRRPSRSATDRQGGGRHDARFAAGSLGKPRATMGGSVWLTRARSGT